MKSQGWENSVEKKQRTDREQFPEFPGRLKLHSAVIRVQPRHHMRQARELHQRIMGEGIQETKRNEQIPHP